jgi:hypothetical protein
MCSKRLMHHDNLFFMHTILWITVLMDREQRSRYLHRAPGGILIVRNWKNETLRYKTSDCQTVA